MRVSPTFRKALCKLQLSLILPLITAGLASNALAQNFERYRPTPPTPVTPYTPELPTPDNTPVEGSTKVLIKELKGFIVVDHKDKVVKEPPAVTGVFVDPNSDLTLARGYGVQSIMERYVGHEISIRKLNEMSREIVLFYGSCGQPVVDVSIPPQDVTSGIIQVIITEARIGSVVIKGGCYFDPGVLARQSWLRSGTRIYESCLREELIYYNQNPFRNVSLDLKQGKQPGTTDVIFTIDDQLPWRWYAGYEDTGTHLTGRERLFYGFNWGDALHQGDLLSYQLTTNADYDHWDVNRLAVHSGTYSHRNYCRDEILLFGSYADIEAPSRRLFGIDNLASFGGQSWQVSARYTRDTPKNRYWDTNRWSVGVDVKSTNNLLDFGIATLNNNTYQICQFMGGWVGRRQRNRWIEAVGVDGYFSPGYLLGKNRSRDFESFRPGASATYAYVRAFAESMYDWNRYSDLVFRGTGQLASSKLVPTEQLGFGGYNTLRGYDMRTYNTDNGIIANFEARTKPRNGTCYDKPSQFVGLAFFDWGYGFNWGNTPSLNNNQMLASTGVGMRYTINPTLTLRADYGIPLNDLASNRRFSGNSTIFNHGRAHIGLVLSR